MAHADGVSSERPHCAGTVECRPGRDSTPQMDGLNESSAMDPLNGLPVMDPLNELPVYELVRQAEHELMDLHIALP